MNSKSDRQFNCWADCWADCRADRRAIQNQNGLALIESLATMAFCSVALVGGLTVTYVSFARVWLNRASYEASVCLSTPETTYNCEKALRESTARALPVGHIDSILLSRYRNSVETRVQWSVSEFKMKFLDRRPIPLLGPSKKVAMP